MLIYKEKLLVSSVNSTAHCGDHFVIEYLGEIETEFEITLGCLSGAPNHEKIGVKNLVTHSL